MEHTQILTEKEIVNQYWKLIEFRNECKYSWEDDTENSTLYENYEESVDDLDAFVKEHNLFLEKYYQRLN